MASESRGGNYVRQANEGLPPVTTNRGATVLFMLCLGSILALAACTVTGCRGEPSSECSDALDCLTRPWPLECDGDWECENQQCVPQCAPVACSAATDCSSNSWTKRCEGHWECTDGECLMVCDSVDCDSALDCILLPWPLICSGHWECRSGECIPECDLPFLCVEEIRFHTPVLDDAGGLLPWTSYDDCIRTAMGFVQSCPTDETTGFPWYMQYSCFHYQNMTPLPWPHNPAGLYAMMVETLVRYWPYTGERDWIDFIRRPLDRLIEESTPDSYLWPHVPYASADNSGQYRGGYGDGRYGIEPDKVAQAAAAYLLFSMVTGEDRYQDEALHCANVLAENIRPGDADHSPWPFRLNARTGEVIEEYTSDVLWPIVLFDRLERMGLATEAHVRARAAAWEWLMAYPMQNMRWKGYFEDVEVDERNDNRDQYTPGEVARYLMQHPELDPDWREHVPRLLSWIKDTFGDTSDTWHGATGIREQLRWPYVSGSHTARYASLCAMWYAAGGGESFREEALRSFALATYMSREDGIVIFSPCDDAVWFTDGYFDYVPHFLDGMGAIPEMAPADEDHLLGSTSLITDISYSPGRVAYTTYDNEGSEVLRLSFTVASVVADGRPLDERQELGSEAGYTLDPTLNVVRVQRVGSSRIVISDR